MKANKFILPISALAVLLLASCGGNNQQQGNGLTEGASGDMEAYENSDVNALEQGPDFAELQMS